VLANGNVFSAAQAKAIVGDTGAHGLMIGRGAIRNPWLFDQIRAELRGDRSPRPAGRAVLNYLHELWDHEITPGVRELSQVQRMKKFTNFIGEGIGAKFLHDIRRVETAADFWRVCEAWLDHENPMSLEPLDPVPVDEVCAATIP
jgi:tRNA-dihydrouridine synthase